jgi:hypothetical protein
VKPGILIGRLAIAWSTVALFFLFGGRWLADLSPAPRAALLFLWVFAVILGVRLGSSRKRTICPSFWVNRSVRSFSRSLL